MADIYIGLMSGTSADSIDCAALDLSSEEIKVLSCNNFEIPKDLKKEILQSSQSEKIEQELIDDLDFRMAEVLADSVKAIISYSCLLYTSPSPRDRTRYRMPSSA